MKSTSILPFLALFSIAPALASSSEDVFFHSLLKRQAPGTPAYACHESCGEAITASRGPDACNDKAFLADYAACLACAGPEDENIWRYYGATLSAAGIKCSLSTTPGGDKPSDETSTSTIHEPTDTHTTLPESTVGETSTTTGSEPESPTSVTTPSEPGSTTVVDNNTAVGTITATPTSSVSGGVGPTLPPVPFTGEANSRQSGGFISVVIAAIVVLGI